MNQLEELKNLGRENRLWRLGTVSAEVIVQQMTPDESPMLVLPMRDVSRAGVKLAGMKPTVCLTDRQLVAVTLPGLLGKPKVEVVRRGEIAAISDYQGRSFAMTLSDGEQVKLRGMIGERKVDEMTERLYAELKGGIHPQ